MITVSKLEEQMETVSVRLYKDERYTIDWLPYQNVFWVAEVGDTGNIVSQLKFSNIQEIVLSLNNLL